MARSLPLRTGTETFRCGVFGGPDMYCSPMISAWWVAVVAVVGAVGCVASETTICPNGRTCPAETVCDTMHDTCVAPNQLTACAGLGSGDPCAIRAADDGICDKTVCIVKGCGDGYRRDNEQCDGDDIPADTDCTKLGFYEEGPPSCNDACSFDTNFETTVCEGFCGDGIFTAGIEVCETGIDTVNSCVDEGFGTGPLDCTDCRADTRRCTSFDWVLDPVTDPAIAIHGTAADDVWAILQNNVTNVVTLVHFDGTAWTPVDLGACALTGLDAQLSDLWAAAPGVVVAAALGTKTVIVATPTSCTKLPLPTTGVGGPHSIWASSATDIWALTFDEIWRYDGTNWTLVRSTIGGMPDEGMPNTIWGSGPNDVWVTISENGGGAHLTHYTGSDWVTPITPAGIAFPARVWGTSATDVYAASDRTGEIARYDGTNWQLISSPRALAVDGYNRIIRGVTTTDGRTYVVGLVGSRYALFMSEDEGWTRLDPPGGTSTFWATSGGALFAVSGTLELVSRLAGTVRTDTPGSSFATELVAHSSDNAIVVDAAGNTIEQWNGVVWQTASTVVGPVDAAYAPDGTAVAISYNNGVYVRGADGTWTNYATPSFFPWRVSALGANDLWVLGILSARLIHPASGTFEHRAFPAQYNNIESMDIYAASSSDIYVVGAFATSDANGTVRTAAILHHDGQAWTAQTAPAGLSKLEMLRANSATDIYALSLEGVLIHSDGSGTWTTVSTPPDLRVTDVAGTATDLFITTSDGLWHFDGTVWYPVSLGIQVGGQRVRWTDDTIQVMDYRGGHHAIVRLSPWN